MSFRKACPRTLDRPIVVFGLEPEELVLIGLVAGGILIAIDPIPAVLVGAAGWIALSRLKEGKPPGYLYEAAHRNGLLDRLPAAFRPSHLLPAKVRYLDAFPGGDSDVWRNYASGRPRLGS